ncbi:MAG: oligosaccharide flippase family protein [Pseudomonadota bacterium]
MSQLVGLLALPLLTRLYTPDDFGVFGVFSGILALVTVVASLRYALAVPLPRYDGAAMHVVAMAGMVVCLVALLTAVVQVVVEPFMPAELQALPSGLVAGLMMLGVLTAGWYQVGSSWAIRQSEHGVIAKTRMQQGFIGAGAQFGFGLIGAGPLGLIVGLLLGQLAGLHRLTVNLFTHYKSRYYSIHWRGVRWAALRYRRFPIYDSWAAALNSASAHAPAVLFAVLFDPKLAGFYVLAVRLISAPIGLVGSSISLAIHPRIVEAKFKGELVVLIRNVLRFLVRGSFVPFAVFIVIAPEMFAYIFGAEWREAGNVASWTALWVAWQFIYSPLSVLHLGLETQKTHLVLQLLFFVLRVGGIVVGYIYGSADLALLLFSLMSMLSYMGGVLVLLYMAGLTRYMIVHDLLKDLIIAFLVFALLFIVLVKFGMTWVLVLAACVLVGYLVGMYSLVGSNKADVILGDASDEFKM